MTPKVCVYCGSRPGSDPTYTAAARALGRGLAARGIGLVDGGGKGALMGAMAGAMAGAVELTQEQYELRHDGKAVDVQVARENVFVVERVGDRVDAAFQDIGVEYYRYLAPELAQAAE